MEPAEHHEALRPAQSTSKGSVGGIGTLEGARDRLACAEDGGAVYHDAVGLVLGTVLECLLEQCFKGVVGVPVALEVSVEAVGGLVGFGVAGACELGDGVSC